MKVMTVAVIGMLIVPFMGMAAETTQPRPNIILFLVDDMGLMDTSVPMLTDKGRKPQRHPLNDWYRTPNMERLAKQGVRFGNFYSHNVCSPTRVSILSGQNAARHGATDWIAPFSNNGGSHKPPKWDWEGLTPEEVALPRALKRAGYRTIHVGKGHVTPANRPGANPINLGFDVNIAGSDIGAPASYYGKNGYGKGSNPRAIARPIPGLEKYHGTDTFLTEALTLEAKTEVDKALAAEKPFFLYMSHYAVHSPFNSDPRFAANYKDGKVNGASKAYATLIEGMDKSLGDLMDHLQDKGVAEKTLILFLGDNGGDAPLAGTDDISSSAPLRGRKGSKWEGGVRVPFIAAWAKPDTNNPWQRRMPISSNSIRKEIGICYDLFPTIASLAGATVPADHKVDGRDLTVLLAGKSDPGHRNAFLNHYPHPRRGESHYFTTWRSGDWKVIYEYLKQVNQRYSLYDLANDPSESNNLATENPDQLRKMMQGMVRELESMDAVYPVKDGRVFKPVIPQGKKSQDPPPVVSVSKPNILFILVDDMGWRDLACYGHEVHETPNIDKLATGGMRFTDAYAACPICGPSRAAIMTGRFPSTSGFVDNYVSETRNGILQRTQERSHLELEAVTLAESLQAGGYQTGFLGKWHLTNNDETHLPTDQGFDVNIAGGWKGHPRDGFFSPYSLAHLEDGPKGEYLTDRLTTEAIGVLDQFSKNDAPWLLYMSYYTVHAPFHSKPEKTKKYAAKKAKNPAYGGMMESMDENIGRILSWLDEKGLRENTVIFFTSDNGGYRPATDNAPLRGHKGDLYDGGIRVSCIIEGSGVGKGAVCDTPIHGVDFYATLLEMAGMPKQPEIAPDSVSLVPLLKGNTVFDRGPMFWHYPVAKPLTPLSEPGSVVRDGDWKYLYFYSDGRSELYNLKEDIGETKNLIDKMPEKAAAMKALLDAKLIEHSALIPETGGVPLKRGRGRKKAKPSRAASTALVSPVKAGTKTGVVDWENTSFGDRPGPFVVHLNCGEGIETVKLLEQDELVVQGLDTDRSTIDAARTSASARKDYAKRITFGWFDGKHLPFIDNSVNSIVASGECQVASDEILRVLTPRGVARINGKEIVKPWPSDIDEWTHHMHGPDNNRVSRDTRLAPPLSHLQWTVGPRYTRHHEHMSSFQAMVSARGKVFYIIDQGLKDSVLLPSDWNLVARDAFNGIELWRKTLPHWFNHMWPFKSGPVVVTRRLVVKDDRLFAALEMGGGISVLDANTGALLHELPGTEGAEEIIVEGELLFVVHRQWLTKADKYNVTTKVTNGGTAGRMTKDFSWNAAAGRQQVTAFDLATRKQLWQKEIPIAPFGLGAREGSLYIFDGEQALSLKADSGQVNWTSPKVSNARAQFSTGAGCNLVCGEERILLGSAAGRNMVALSAKDGTIVWQAAQYTSGRHSPKDLFLIDGTAWTAATFGSSMTLPGVPSTANRKSGKITGYNLDDGKIVADFFTDSDVYIMNSRCHMSCATDNYLITSRTGAELVSITDKKWNLHHWLRGACLYGMMPANGILYAPPNPCGCYTQSSLDGFNAVTGYNPKWKQVVQERQGPAFVRGASYSNVPDLRSRGRQTVDVAGTSALSPDLHRLATAATKKFQAGEKTQSGHDEPDAWPVYRHDNKRSGSIPVEVALPLAVKWRAQGYDNLTSLVVANGRCIFAEKDRHTAHCLDATSGKPQWSYVAGGRIDSPPAISGDSLYFGCADGWLYRLLLSTGELVWKRRIAPADLSLFDHGQPASAWPLSGSVLVQDGKVYCVAGRSLFLDDGMRLTVVDAESGEVLKENIMDGRDPNTGEDMHKHVAMQNMPVALPDLLSSDGKNLYMLSQQFDLEGKRTHIKNSAWDDDIEIGIGREHLFCPTGFLDDNWFHRSYWVYGNSFLEGCSMPSGGWFEISRISPSGKMLCFDDTTVYGYGQFPEYSKWSTPLRYSLFSVNNKPKSHKPGVPDEELRKTRPNWRKFRTLRSPKVEFDFHWKSGVPVRAKAIVKTADTLFVAGPEDVLDEERVFQDARSGENRESLQKQNELINSRKGGNLLAVSVRDGSTQQTVDLESQPVWDGMAVAYGRLFMCCRDGSVVAFKGGQPFEDPEPDQGK